MKTTSRLKQIVARRAAVQAPGTANALFARVIEELGFEVVDRKSTRLNSSHTS